MSNINLIEGKVLGQQIPYPQNYSPEILVAIPRHFNREQYAINEDQLPFTGFDTWHCYEFSFLTNKGFPVCGLLKIIYPCDSQFLVESKSLKLYLNSFNMMKFGTTVQEGTLQIIGVIEKDLNQLLKTRLQVELHQKQTAQKSDFEGYEVIEERSECETIVFENYSESPELLTGTDSNHGEIKLCSHLLRSNCKITNQPDWGSVYIHIKSNTSVDPISLLTYLVSFRNENHFHEEVCEMIYKRLLDKFSPEILAVTCIYTRRGGIDICPSRANKTEYLPTGLQHPQYLTPRLLRQ